jgi:hypothetical protein
MTMSFCRVCLFALAFCGCSVAEQRQVLDASKVAADASLKAAECAVNVQDAYATADKKNPAVALGLAADLEKCVKPLIETAKAVAKSAKK